MINSHVELKTWVREHMAALIQSGRLFDKKAYKECFKILKKARSVGLIIPLDEEAVMEPQVDSFMRVIQERGRRGDLDLIATGATAASRPRQRWRLLFATSPLR